MSKGMKFLNKKSWHTAKIQNIEQVWVAESKKKDEARKLLELKKQLDEERAVEGLRAVQAQSGLITSAQASRLDWMYTGAPVADAKTQEDYLTGKEKKLELDKEDVMKLNEKKAVGSLFLRDGVNVELEATNRLRDDPMTIIARQEHEARQNVLKNPVQMKQIKAKADLLEKLKKETAKRKKRERNGDNGNHSDNDHHDDRSDKKKKKKKKSKRSSQSRSRSRSRSPSNSHNNRDARNNNNDSRHSSNNGSNNNGNNGNDVVSSPAVAAVAKKYGLIHSSNIATTLTGGRSLLSAPVFVPAPEPAPTPSSSSSSKGSSRRHDSSRRSSRSRSRSPTDRRRSGHSSHSHSSNGNSTSSNRSRVRSRSRSRSRDRRHNSRDRGHTRPSSSSSSNNHDDSNDARAAIARDNGKKATYQRRSITSTKLSAEEIAAKLSSMQSVAATHDAAAISRMNDARISDKKEMEELLNRGNPDANPAKFVEDLNKKLYTSGEENIEDRLKKYSHYRQKGNTEHHSFMSR